MAVRYDADGNLVRRTFEMDGNSNGSYDSRMVTEWDAEGHVLLEEHVTLPEEALEYRRVYDWDDGLLLRLEQQAEGWYYSDAVLTYTYDHVEHLDVLEFIYPPINLPGGML